MDLYQGLITYHNSACPAMVAVFAQVDSLPRAEIQLAVGDCRTHETRRAYNEFQYNSPGMVVCAPNNEDFT